jgi:allene oxide cyclase
MKNTILLAATAAAGLAAVAVSSLPTEASDSKQGHSRVIKVYERATNLTPIDLGATGDSQGDMLVFDNKVFDAATHVAIGSARGQCYRTVVGQAYECSWTNTLPGGSIMVSGPFFDAAESTLAITGGTGAYRNARGEMQFRFRGVSNGSPEFDFIFRISRDD